MSTFNLICYAAAAALLTACATSQPTANASAVKARAPIGGSCASDGDCEVGASCDKDDPGGECTKKCASTADCGPGNVCRPDEKECLQGCRGQGDCKRPGYVCMGTAPELFCDIPEQTEKH